MKFDSRKRILLLSSLLALVHIILARTDLNAELGLNLPLNFVNPFFLAAMAYLGTAWVLYFKVKGERLFTVLMFPAISIFAFSTFVELLMPSVVSGLGQLSLIISSAVVIWVFIYIVLLTVNILNAAFIHDIPLGQAARAALFVLNLIISYVVAFLTFSNEIFLPIKVAIFFLIALSLTYIGLWSIKINLYQKLISSLTIGFIYALGGLILSLWPITAPYSSLVVTLVFYTCLGIALEVRDIISDWIWIEYTSLFVLILLLLGLVAEWGINGTLI